MSDQQKGPDEIYCRSCGSAIKKEAEICPECGVKNNAGASRNNGSRQKTRQVSNKATHDPSQFDTTVSDSWYYGIVVGIALWLLLFLMSSINPTGSVIEVVLGLVVLAAWSIMPVSVYFDTKYVRANSHWNPNSVLWVIAMAIWLVNLIAGAVYLYRRHESLGTP